MNKKKNLEKNLNKTLGNCMILLQLLKLKFNLIVGKGFCYSRVMIYMLDISSPKSTICASLLYAMTCGYSTVVSRCSCIRFKVSI